MRVRVKGRPGNRITGSAYARIASRLACPTRSENRSKRWFAGLASFPKPARFWNSECGAWWAVMRLSLVILAGCDRAERRLVGSGPTKRRAVPSAPGGGRHATPGWVLHSNSGCCIGTIKKSRTYEISSTIERFRALSVNFLKIKGRQKSQQLKKKSLASLS